MIKKAVMMFVLLLLCSSIFAFAQESKEYTPVTPAREPTSAGELAPVCTLFCKIGRFFFGSKEARAGRAWFDRSEALVGEALTLPEVATLAEAPPKGAPTGKELFGEDAPCPNCQYFKYQGQYLFYDPSEDFSTNVPSQQIPELEKRVAGGITLPTVTLPDVKLFGVAGLKDVPVWKGEKTFPPGTVYTNDKGEYFIANKKGIGEKVTAEAALQKLHENAAKSQLQQSLGASYQQFEKSVGKVKSVYERPEAGVAGVLVISGSGGEIIVDKETEDGVQTARYLGRDNKVIESYIVKDGQVLATQTADGRVKVGETSYNFPKGKVLTESISDLTKGIQLPGKEGPSGLLKLEGDVFIAVDYEKETMQRTNTKMGEKENVNVDYYKEGESGCKIKSGCFVETGGEAVVIDANGVSQSYLVDYDYEGTGADRTLEEKQYFNPLTGNKEGATFADGTQVIAQKDANGKYTGEYSFATPDGTTATVKREGDIWQPTENKARRDTAAKYGRAVIDAESFKDEQGNQKFAIPEDLLNTPDNQLSAAEKEAKSRLQAAKAAAEKAATDDAIVAEEANKEENRKRLGDIEATSQGGLATARGVIQSIYAVTNNLKSYPAISNLLFGEANFYKAWRSDMDKAFAPLLASNWFPSAICEDAAQHWKYIEPEGKAVIKTVSGTYQAVASIQMERSPETSPVLCHKNPDEESDKLFICGGRQVCVDDTFCYADQDRDNEPDHDEPLKGYFYKITWAVTSPQDEALTPLVDENGVAVSFNIFLYPGAVPLYNLNGNIASPIQLQNGASDKDAIIKYSTNLYDQACIRWNQAPRTITVPGGEDVEDVCFSVVTSSVGQVNWERSGQEAASVTVSHGEVNRNTDW